MQSSHELEYIATLASVLASILRPKCSVRSRVRLQGLSRVGAHTATEPVRLQEWGWKLPTRPQSIVGYGGLVAFDLDGATTPHDAI